MKRNILGCVVLASCLLFSNGCILLFGAAAGVGGVSYAKGDLVYTVDDDSNDVHDAVLKTMRQRAYFVEVQEQTALKGKIKAKMPARDGTRVTLTVKLKRTDFDGTRISVRVGKFGDEGLSRAIMEDIRDNLESEE